MAAKIKKGDKVVVLAGKDKGKTGNVTQVIPSETRAAMDTIVQTMAGRWAARPTARATGRFSKACAANSVTRIIWAPCSDIVSNGRTIRSYC